MLCGAGIVKQFQKCRNYLAVLAYGLFAFLLTTFFEIAVYGEKKLLEKFSPAENKVAGSLQIVSNRGEQPSGEKDRPTRGIQRTACAPFVLHVLRVSHVAISMIPLGV